MQRGDRNLHVFCVRAEDDLLSGSVSIGLVSVWVVEMDWLLYAGRKSLGFRVSMETDLFFCEGGRNLFDFGVGGRS